jgi:hypothetical protein
MRADDPAPRHDDGESEAEAGLERQVERYRPWYRRERHAAAALVGVSVATIAASAVLFGSTLSLGGFAELDDAPTTLTNVELVGGTGEADESPTALLAADDPVGVPDERVPRPITGSATGVAAAVDEYGVIAAWTDRIVWVSRDDGRTFRQELAAPQPITAVAVGTQGRVYAARHGGQIQVLTPSGSTGRLAVRAEQVLALDASSAWLAVLALHTDDQGGLAPLLWLSQDGGRSWRGLIVPSHGSAANLVRVGPTGVIDLLALDADTEAGGGQLRHYTGHVDGRPFELAASREDPQPFGLDRMGQTWAVAREPDAATSRLVQAASWDVHLASSRDRTIAAADGRLLELDPEGAHIVAERLPGPIHGLAVDGLGRSLVLVGSAVFRHSSRHGWRRLFEIPPP